jgi:hypothetical protein
MAAAVCAGDERREALAAQGRGPRERGGDAREASDEFVEGDRRCVPEAASAGMLAAARWDEVSEFGEELRDDRVGKGVSSPVDRAVAQGEAAGADGAADDGHLRQRAEEALRRETQRAGSYGLVLGDAEHDDRRAEAAQRTGEELCERTASQTWGVQTDATRAQT